MQKITRRALAQIAAAAGALRAQEPSAYIGPLTGVDKKAEGRVLDPLPYALRLVDAAPRQLRFSARNKAQAEKWQGRLRAKLAELVGGFPKERSPLRPLTLEARDSAGTGARRSFSTARMA